MLGQPVVADMEASQGVLEETRLVEAPWDGQAVAEQEAAEPEVEQVVHGCVPAP